MRTSIKIIITAWAILLLLIGVLFFNAYSRLHPEKMVALLKSQVQKNYPGSELTIEKVDYFPSVDFNIRFKNLQLLRNDRLIGKLAEVEFRIPWWLLIFNKGKAQINLNHLEVFIDNSPVTSKSGPPVSDEEAVFVVEVPGYLSVAQFTLRAQDVAIKDLKDSRNLFRVSKLLVREFQYDKNSAFEIKLPISLTHGELSYNSELWLFGDVTPSRSGWDLNYRGEFRTKDTAERLQFEDIVINGRTRFVPSNIDLKTQLELFADKQPMGKGVLELDRTGTKVELDFSQLPVSFLSFFKSELSNPFLTKWEGDSTGRLKISKKFNDEQIDLKGHLLFPGNFELLGGDKIEGKWRLDFNDSIWTISFMSPKGDLSYFRRSVVDLETPGKIKQYNEEIGFTGYSLDSAIKAVSPLQGMVFSDRASFFTTKIAIKNAAYGDKSYDGLFEKGVTPDKKAYHLDLKSGPDYFITIDFQDASNTRKVDATFKNFKWSSAFNFLSPYFNLSEGVTNGTLKGRWEASPEDGEWLVTLKLAGFQELGGTLPRLIQDLSGQFSLKLENAKELNLDMSIKGKMVKLNSLLLGGEDPSRLTGLIDQTGKQKSHLTLTYPKNKSWKAVKKEVPDSIWQKDLKND